MSDLSKPEFHDETAAREWLESELWANGPGCPHCGTVDQATLLQRGTKPRKNQPEKSRPARDGLYQCNACHEPFTVTVGTLYERSHIPLHKWLAATHLMMASKKGMSAMQIHRMLGISYKSAWFMCHRIRESLRDTKLDTPLGGQNKVVEADETYIGGKEGNKHKSKRRLDGARGPIGKEPVVSLVERDGRIRSQHMPEVTAKNLRAALKAQVDKDSYLMTDESGVYVTVGREFAGHGTVNHSIEEYVRGGFWHTNTVEGYFSILKRGIVGTYHHVSQQHLKRYLAEFDYRYNERQALGISDSERMAKSIPGIVGKRLTYRRSHNQV
jgi:transposase-like protein